MLPFGYEYVFVLFSPVGFTGNLSLLVLFLPGVGRVGLHYAYKTLDLWLRGEDQGQRVFGRYTVLAAVSRGPFETPSGSQSRVEASRRPSQVVYIGGPWFPVVSSYPSSCGAWG